MLEISHKLDRIITIASRDVLDVLEVAVRDVDGHELLARGDKVGDEDGRDVAEAGEGQLTVATGKVILPFDAA